MTIYAINAKLFLDSESTPDEIGMTFEQGAENALSQFPHGSIFEVEVDDVTELSAEEIAERGFEE